MAEAPAPQGTIRSGVLEDSNLDPFNLMDRGTFKRFVQHYAPDLMAPDMRRDGLTFNAGGTEGIGTKDLLKQRGFTGREPIPDGVRASVSADPMAAEEFREARAQANVKLQSDLQDKVSGLDMPQLRKLGKVMGVKQKPKTKKAELEQMILDAASTASEEAAEMVVGEAGKE